jgi:hypothetical protein
MLCSDHFSFFTGLNACVLTIAQGSTGRALKLYTILTLSPYSTAAVKVSEWNSTYVELVDPLFLV